jgi:hypothetical protein
MYKVSYLYTITMLYLSLISVSPILIYFGLNAILILLPVIGVFVYYTTILNRKINIYTILIIVTISILSFIVALYHQRLIIFFIPIFFIINILYINIFKKDELYIFVNIATYFLIVIMILSIFGIFYHYFGGQSILTIINADGRPNNLYLTTFSNTNTEWVRFIRPSGFFDEPGALSFFICALTIVRHILKLNKNVTLSLLLLGIFTFSLAHILFILFYFLSETRFSIKRMLYYGAVFSVFSVIVINTPLSSMVNLFFFNRIEISDDGMLKGDNRTERMINAISLLNINNIFFGLDNECIVSPHECEKYGSIDSNPVAPLVRQGILLSFPYYAYLFIILYGLIKYKDPIYLGLFLLVLQRPNVMTLGYSFWAILIMILIINNKKYLK